MLLHTAIGIVYTVIILEVLFRFIEHSSFPLFIFTCELVVVGIFLLIVTIKFNKLTDSVFENDFREEQRYFKTSLIVFLSTYLIRTVLLVFCLFFFDAWINYFYRFPIAAILTQSVLHMLYDAWPVVIIMA